MPIWSQGKYASHSQPLITTAVEGDSSCHIVELRRLRSLRSRAWVHLCNVSLLSWFVYSAIAVIFAYLALATRQSDVDKSTGIKESLAGATLGRLRLLGFLDLVTISISREAKLGRC